MKKNYCLLIVLCLISLATNAQKIIGTGLPSVLFELREMDMHNHSGKERDAPLHKWIDLSVKDGRKVMVILDHLELYRMPAKETKEWTEERKFQDWYPTANDGHTALMKDLSSIENRDDIITFRGWEISEDELDTGIEVAPMKLAEVIGWHISPKNGGDAPNEQTLLKRASQVINIQKEFPIPMILFHPFSMRIENIQRTVEKSNRAIASISVDEYRFFKPGEQEQLIEVLRGQSVYIEISHDLSRYWDNKTVRESVIEDVRPLVEAGIQFAVSTDAHGVSSLNNFNPNYYCDDLGITPKNTNAIVRELIAIRAIQDFSGNKP
jgi:hypothetical protein